MIYETNMRSLKEYYGELHDVIEKEYDKYIESYVKVEQAKNGDSILKVCVDDKNIYLNSRYNSTNEAHKYMEQYFDMPEESLLIMYGLSNASYVREFLKNSEKNIICLIYEPSPDIFMQVIRNIDITDIIESSRVHIAVEGFNEDSFSYILEGRIQIHNTTTNKHIELPHYVELFPEGYERFKQETVDLYEKFYIVENTASKYGKKVVRNNIMNMRFIKGCRCLTDLIGKIPQDIPAIIVAAGPSLDKNVQLLKQAKGKAFIVVVDTAIKRVLKEGIIPDAIITIDMIKPLKLFEGEAISDIPLLADMDANYEVFDYVKPNNLVFFSSDSVIWDKLFKSTGHELRTINSGGSVATSAISVMMELGIKRIVFIGFDLGFSENKAYAGAEAKKVEYNPDHYVYVEGICEEKILVRRDYYNYLRWVESVAGRFTEFEFIDATEGGTKKKNTKIMTLQEVIDKYCTKEVDIAAVFNECPRVFDEANENTITDVLDNMKRNLKNMRKKLSDCAADCRRGKLILESGENNIRELKRINANIEKVDELIEDCDERVYLYKYLTDAEANMMKDMYIVEEDHIQESIRMYEKSRDYYEAIIEAIPQLIDIIDDCKREIE